MAKTQAEYEKRASAEEIAAPEHPIVTVRVLKKGDGKISTGDHDKRGGEVVYEYGETFPIAQDIAQALEDRGYAEIQPEPIQPEPKKA